MLGSISEGGGCGPVVYYRLSRRVYILDSATASQAKRLRTLPNNVQGLRPVVGGFSPVRHIVTVSIIRSHDCKDSY